MTDKPGKILFIGGASLPSITELYLHYEPELLRQILTYNEAHKKCATCRYARSYDRLMFVDVKNGIQPTARIHAIHDERYLAPLVEHGAVSCMNQVSTDTRRFCTILKLSVKPGDYCPDWSPSTEADKPRTELDPAKMVYTIAPLFNHYAFTKDLFSEHPLHYIWVNPAVPIERLNWVKEHVDDDGGSLDILNSILED